MAGQHFKITGDNSDLLRKLEESRQAIRRSGDAATSMSERIRSSMEHATSGVQELADMFQPLTAVMAGVGITGFVSQMVKVRSEIESLSISFETLLGDRGKAEALFSEIRSFAVLTPMELAPLAKGAQTLLSFNVSAKEVMPVLRQIGDISMGNADKFNSLVLAFSQMSSTGKLMGQDLLQMINAGFNPLSVIALNTGKSMKQLKQDMSDGAISAEMVAEAFRSATAEGGKFHGMLEKQSQGLAGSLSNLQGAIEEMFNSLGEKNQGFIVSAIQGATGIVQNYEAVGRSIMEIVAAYGVYRAALMAITLIDKQRLAFNVLVREQMAVELALRKGATAAMVKEAAVTKALAIAKGQLVASLKSLGKAMFSNPYVLMAAGIAAAAYGLYRLITYQTDAEKAQKRLNEAMKDFNRDVEKEKINIDILFGRLRKAEEGTEGYKKAKDAIISQYGEYLQGLGDEIRTLNPTCSDQLVSS